MMLKKILVGFQLVFLLCTIPMVLANTAVSPAADPDPPVVDSVPSKVLSLPFGKDKVEYLPAIGAAEGVSADSEAAVEGFGNIIRRVLLFLRMFLGAIALFYLFIAGYTLITAGSGITEAITKQKNAIMYLAMGAVLITLSQEIVDLFYPPLDAERFGFIDDPKKAGQKIAVQITNIVNYFLSFVGAGAILVLVVSSVRLVLNPGSEDEVNKQKKIVGYTAMGIIMIAMSERLINVIIFADGGKAGVNVGAGLRELTGLSNYILGFLGVVIMVVLVYAGFNLLVYYGDDQKITDAKTMVYHTIIGSVIAFSAYTIVATIVNVLQ